MFYFISNFIYIVARNNNKKSPISFEYMIKKITDGFKVSRWEYYLVFHSYT